MREKSVMSRRFIAQKKVFADIFNFHLYQGRRVIKEEDLQMRDMCWNLLVHPRTRHDYRKLCVIRHMSNWIMRQPR